jgi:hypothetical protein
MDWPILGCMLKIYYVYRALAIKAVKVEGQRSRCSYSYEQSFSSPFSTLVYSRLLPSQEQGWATGLNPFRKLVQRVYRSFRILSRLAKRMVGAYGMMKRRQDRSPCHRVKLDRVLQKKGYSVACRSIRVLDQIASSDDAFVRRWRFRIPTLKIQSCLQETS